jgi:hypothetical protein
MASLTVSATGEFPRSSHWSSRRSTWWVKRPGNVVGFVRDFGEARGCQRELRFGRLGARSLGRPTMTEITNRVTVPPEPTAHKAVSTGRPDLVGFFRDRAPEGQAGFALKKVLFGMVAGVIVVAAAVDGNRRYANDEANPPSARIIEDESGQDWAVIARLDETEPGTEIRIALPFQGIDDPNEVSVEYSRESDPWVGGIVCSTLTLHQDGRTVFAGHFPESKGTVRAGEPAPTTAADRCATSWTQFGPAYDESLGFSR